MTLVVTSSWPRTGDEMAGTFVRTDAATRGEVVVAAPEGPGVARRGDRIDVVDLPHHGLFGSPGAAHRLRASPLRARGIFPFLSGVRRIVRERRPARVVAHWLLPGGSIARLAAPSLPTEIVAHGADVRLLEAMPRAVAARTLDWLRDGSVEIRAVSDSLAARIEAIREGSVDRVEAMPLGPLEPAREKGRLLRARHGTFAIVAARLVPEKRIERAIDHLRGGRIVLLGDGPSRRDLVRRAWSSGLDVIAPGAVPHEEALAWIAASERVLAPVAPGEGAPTVIREGRALDREVVTFD